MNDNAPLFPPTPYEHTVFENVSVPRELLTVTATDADVTIPFRTLTYFITNANGTVPCTCASLSLAV